MLQEFFNLLDLPGSSARDLLAGENPFDQWASPLSDRHRITGAELVSRYTGVNPNSTAGKIAGFGAEVLVDPMNLIGGVGAVNKALKARRLNAAAKSANALEAGRYGFTAAGRAADAASPLMRAPVPRGLQGGSTATVLDDIEDIGSVYDPSWGDTAYEAAMGIPSAAVNEEAASPLAGLLPYHPNYAPSHVQYPFRSQAQEFVDEGLPPRFTPQEFPAIAKKAGVKAEELKDIARKDPMAFGGDESAFSQRYLESLLDDGDKSIDSKLMEWSAWMSPAGPGQIDVVEIGGKVGQQAENLARVAKTNMEKSVIRSRRARTLAINELVGGDAREYSTETAKQYKESIYEGVMKAHRTRGEGVLPEAEVRSALNEMFVPESVFARQWMNDDKFDAISLMMREIPGSPLASLSDETFEKLLDNRENFKWTYDSLLDADKAAKNAQDQFSTYTVPTGDKRVPGSYRELIIKNNDLGYDRSHFVGPPGKDYVAHVRLDGVSDRDTGKKILRIQEVQSDLHQNARKYGYADSPLSGPDDRVPKKFRDDLEKSFIDVRMTYQGEKFYTYLKSLEKNRGDLSKVARETGYPPSLMESLQRGLDGADGGDEIKGAVEEATDRLRIDKARTWKELQSEGMKFLENRTREGWSDKGRNDLLDYFRNSMATYHDITEILAKELPSDAPFKESWDELGVKAAVQHAINEGYDSIGLVPGSSIAKAVGADPVALEAYHDTKLAKFLKKIADRYGTQVRTVEGRGDLKYVLDITPDMRRAIRKEGQYAYPGYPPLPPDKLQPMAGPVKQPFRTRAAAADSPLVPSYSRAEQALVPMFSRRQALTMGLYNAGARQGAVTVE